MNDKRQPLYRTAVLAVMTDVVDRSGKSPGIRHRVTSKIGPEEPHMSGDVVVGPDTPFQTSCKKQVVISSMAPFLLDLYLDDRQLDTITVNGLFASASAFSKIVVRSAENIRVSYAIC